MTSAPVITELPKSYVPLEHEENIRARWDAAGIFHAEPRGEGDDRPAYCILIPPPNVTAALHLGHAFNNSLQDILVRVHRMRGYNTLWMPGTDHAGIATQTVVDKRLQAQGQNRRDLGREAFVEKVQEWKDEYEQTITTQLKVMGCSCDWQRQRFTMDPICARAVREAFFRLFCDDLIYRGKRLVNWDPVSLTALADDEVEMEEVQGHMWYLRYPIVDPDPDGPAFVTVATTRPETMLGDSAVAMNPADPRAGALVGKSVRVPIVDRVVSIIADDYVVLPVSLGGPAGDAKAEIATGFLKVTPAHDPNDWDIGQRHGLDVINVMAPDASISDEHGWDGAGDEVRPFIGLAREEARGRIVEWFKAHDLLESVRDYTHSVGHSYRSHVPIEPYLSDQWYVKVSDDRLVGEAQRALVDQQFEGRKPARANGKATTESPTGDGELRFFPARYARTYQAWHENLRDWCISRQLWWGHRIPVWRVPQSADASAGSIASSMAKLREWEQAGRVAFQHGGRTVSADEIDTHAIDLAELFVCVREPETDEAIVSLLEAAGLQRDPDVLDTWFSSGLWPLNTMGWPEPDVFPETTGLLETFNPSAVLGTAREIITLWVSRMVMFNRYFNHGTVPFRDVYIHAMIQDGHGQKMSKSLGNGVDPRDIIHSHGADALRFTLTQMATATQDVRMGVDTVCPHCEATFHPQEISSPAGYRVAAPEQPCPECSRPLVTAYGVAAHAASPRDEAPLARNSSSRFDQGRNFCNKLWNATRFAMSRLAGDSPADGSVDLTDLAVIDRWIINRLHTTLHTVEDALAEYQFSAYAEAMYDFIWRDFCDWYLEGIKTTVADRPQQQQVLRTVLNATLRLLQPICPFVTESLWGPVQATGTAGVDGIVLPDSELLAAAAWPDIACRVHDGDASDLFERGQALVNAIRGLRAQYHVPPRKLITLFVTSATRSLIESLDGVVEVLAGLEVAGIESRADGAIPLAFEGEELALAGLVDAVDPDAERNRLEKLVGEKKKAIAGFRGRLSNEGYVKNAKPEVVDETRNRLAQAEADLEAARGSLAALAD